MSSRPGENGVQYDVLLVAIREHTQQLLGATIGFSEEQWALPSGLPGWTRSHVAAHLVENARGFLRVCRSIALDRPTGMYESHREKVRAIEEGALASGLRLQVDLDTSASELQTLLPSLEGNATEVELRPGYRLAVNQIPLARLFEVVVHSVDMGVDGFRVHVDDDIAEMLLAFEAERIGRRPDLPGMLILADEGFRARLGGDDEFDTIGGPSLDLLLWLTRNRTSPRLRGI